MFRIDHPTHSNSHKRGRQTFLQTANRNPTDNEQTSRRAQSSETEASVYLQPIHTTLGIENITSTERALPHPRLFSNNFVGNTRLCELTLSLTTADTASGGPGEVSDGDDEEAVASIGDTSEGIVPSGESSEETEETTGLLDVGVGVAVGTALQVGDTEQEEGEVQGEEQHEEGDGGLESAEQQDGGEDEPALL